MIKVTVGADLPYPEGLAASLNETKKYAVSATCRNNHCNRLKAIIKFWKNHAPEYHRIGVVDVSEWDQYDVTKTYFFDGKFKFDLVYEGINVDFVLLFLAKNKTYKSKKIDTILLKCWDDLRKYRDAIQWGAKMTGHLLPTSFYVEFESFLNGYKKEHTSAKAEGRVDEPAADPI